MQSQRLKQMAKTKCIKNYFIWKLNSKTFLGRKYLFKMQNQERINGTEKITEKLGLERIKIN